jgi:hypothetical protein
VLIGDRECDTDRRPAHPDIGRVARLRGSAENRRNPANLAPRSGRNHGQTKRPVHPRRQLGDGRGDNLDDPPDGGEALCRMLHEAMDRRQQIEPAARIVARYLRLGHPPPRLLIALAGALLREDAGFHATQMLEAGVRQFAEWPEAEAGHHILVAVTRFLAAHAPTRRAQVQTARIARRLHRGEVIHEDQPDN